MERIAEIEVNARSDDWTATATLSSEYPVRRYDGEEVLSHDPGAVDLSRAPLPLIVAHDAAKLPVGVVEGLRIEGSKLRGTLRFSKNAVGIWTDVRDGILRNISIGYRILAKTKTQAGYIATKWMPYECSLVAAGADPTAGIGRNYGGTMMDKNDLLKERKVCVDGMIALAGKSEMSAEDKEAFDRLKSGLENCDRRLDAILDLERIKKNAPAAPVPEVRNQTREIRFQGGAAADRSYRGMFGEPSFSIDEITAFRTSFSTGVPSGGGLAVPDPLSAKWLDDALPDEIIRPRAQVFPMTSGTLKVPGWDWTDMSLGKCFGGFEMAWSAELAVASPQKGKVRVITLSANKAQIYADVSQELFDDGLGIDSQIDRAMRKSISYGLESAFWTGTGSGMPLGITRDPALITIDPETGQSSDDTIVFENIVKMFARMYPQGRQNAIWVANATCLPQLLTMGVTHGLSGTWVNVFSEKDGHFSLLGRPLLFDGGHLPVLGAANDLMFVDLANYAIGLRRDMRIEKSNIPMWTSDQMSYRIIIRVDGQGTWAEAFTPDNGDSMSWCVALGARS